jgi:hypothetical protein
MCASFTAQYDLFAVDVVLISNNVSRWRDACAASALANLVQVIVML